MDSRDGFDANPVVRARAVKSHAPGLDPASIYSIAEEIASSSIHGLGALLSVVGLILLVAMANAHGDARHLISVCVYGASLIALYTASTLYHSIPGKRAKSWLRTVDHSTIFLLIAGTYTPFTLITLRGRTGWILFGVIWALAIIGIALELLRLRKRSLAVALYLGMGWAAIFAIGPLIDNLPRAGLWLMLAGGVSYTLGVPFYLWKRLPFNHALWHGFVLLGSMLHFLAVLYFVLPQAA